MELRASCCSRCCTCCPGERILALSHTDTWIGILFTVIGAAWVFKGTLYLAWPEFGLRMIARGVAFSDAKWSVAGSLMFVFAGIAVWGLVR